MSSLQVAMKQAQQGSLIEIAAGNYFDGGVLKADDVTIKAEQGAHLSGFSIKGKGSLVIQGDNTRIFGLECSQVSVADNNGACVRLEGRNLQLSNVYFHDSQQGLLSGKGSGLILIENSRFERLGKLGQAHGIYVGSGELFITNSHFLSSKDEGHEIKSRATKTIIQDTTIASLYGRDSRLIDVSSGGILEVTGCVLQQGNNTSNSDLIGFALEGTKHKINTIKIQNNIFLLDRERGNRLLHTRGKIESMNVSNNIIIGRLSGNQFDESNTFYKNRKVANLKPFPALAKIGHDGD
ncbi:MAG: hypothetical protein OQK09_09935 [Colwellia sp.]|nr:hypothetical protein [Colwellia sp.]MCW8865246.1 hypothetical protein [Colwellia sp.]MCW9081817.1 hypothetical protein [Colwellia sp.]